MDGASEASFPDFQILFESAPGLYLVLTRHLKIVAASTAYLRATMTKREDIIGRSLFDVFPDNPEDIGATGVSNLKASLNRVIALKKPDAMAVQKYDIRKPLSEGGGFEERYWDPLNSPIFNKKGEVEYIIHRVEDVTEFVKLKNQGSQYQKENKALRVRTDHMEAEIYQSAHELAEARTKLEATNRALEDSRNYLKSILDHVVDPIFVKDRQHRWIDGNNAFWEMMGKPRKEVLGKSDYDIFPKEEADVFWQKDDEVFNSRKTNINIENFTDTNGNLHIISTKKACFKGQNNEQVLVGIIRDVTEVTRMQEQLSDLNRATTSLLASIVESSGDAILSGTLDGIITSWNEAASRLYGYTAQEAIGQHISLIVPPEYRGDIAHFIAVLNAGKRVERFETTRLHKNGKRIEILLTISPIRDPSGRLTGVSTIAHDITEEKRIERQLKTTLEEIIEAKKIAEEAQQKAEVANIAKSQFLANMSHEIRTPLNSMIGLTELLLETELSVQQDKHLHTVLKSGENLIEIINDMLDFSKIEAGKLELEEAPFDLQAAVEDTAELFAPKVGEKEQHLELLVDFVTGTPRHVIGDVVRIRQILSNLLNNAIKFTHSGYIMVKVEAIADALQAEGVAIQISVSDTGIGIPADKLQIIFDKFSQADISTTRKFGGTGLGLAICKQLAVMMGGGVTVKSSPGLGSTFTASVVLKRAADAVDTTAAVADHALLLGKRALIVDDVEASGAILLSQLAGAGVISVCTKNSAIALKMISGAIADGKPYDILVTDYILPEMESDAFTAKAKALSPDIIIVMITALVDKGYAQIFSSSGCDAYLTKPVRKNQFLDVLATIYGARNSGKVLSMLSPPAISSRREAVITVEDNEFFEGAKILLVEDNRANSELGMSLLKKFGCCPTAVRNGEEAVEIATKQEFDLIFMDCQMPEMDGFEASSILSGMKKTRKIKDVPIIALTANAMVGDREKCLQSGMNDYLSKPLRRMAIRNMLITWLPPKEKRAAAA